MAYPIESITPESPDPDKEAALMATIEQMVSEGMTPEEAQTNAMQLLQNIMTTPWPEVAGATDYGNAMKPNSNFMRERGTGSPRTFSYKDGGDQRLTNFRHGFNSDGRVSNK